MKANLFLIVTVVLLSLLAVPAFAEDDGVDLAPPSDNNGPAVNQPVCPPSQPVASPCPTTTCRTKVMILVTASEITVGDVHILKEDPNGNNGEGSSPEDNGYIVNPGFYKHEVRQLQDELYTALGKTPGPVQAMYHPNQVTWVNTCNRDHINDPHAQVMLPGAPKLGIEITSVAWGNADNKFALDDLQPYINGCDWSCNGWSYLPLEAGVERQFTTVRLEAVVRDIATKEEICRNGVMVVAEAKGEANNTAFVASIFGSSKQKNTNLVTAHKAAVANLAKELQKQLSGLL